MRLHPLLPLAAVPLVVALAATPGAAPFTAAGTAPSSRALTVTASGLEAAQDQDPGDAMLSRVGGAVPPGAWQRASAQARASAVRTAAVEPALAKAGWQLKGPTNIGGRVLDVVVDPKKTGSVYVATASGGVWHTVDAGATFTSVWPEANSQSIGALAISKTGVLWAGTGEAGPGGGSITYGGDGIWRSTDGGRTWKNMGLRGTERIGRVVVDPKDENTVWVAANGSLFTPGGERGLYRTQDGGKSWKLMLAGANGTTGAVDVALDPVDRRVVYMTMWDRIRYPDRRVYTGVGSGVFKSTDGGSTWNRIGLPYFVSNPELGRLGVAVAPSDHKRVYVLASTEAGLTAGLARSNDGGATFTPAVDVPLVTGGFVYAWWFGRVYVDPADPDHVFATGVNMSESKDGGVSFSSSPGLHSDQHAMAWDTRIKGRVYVGNDGGFYRSDNNAGSFKHGEYMPWNQLFSVDVSQQDKRKLVAGLQDNGGNRNYTAKDEPSNSGYKDITGGDGTEMAIDPSADKYVYGCSQYGACARSTNGGTTMSDFSNDIVGARKNWQSPIEFDPTEKGAVYTASEIVHKSTDFGATWTPISPDLTGGPGRETNPLFRNYGTVTTIAAAGGAEFATVYAGTDDGRVQYTHSNGPVWTRATGLPTDWVTALAIDYRDPTKTAYATFSAFRSGGKKAMVFRTRDGGVTWKDLTGDLPLAPVNDVLPVGDDLLVASDVGVFLTHGSRTATSPRWLKVGAGLPNSPITDLKWQAASKTLFAANFGRGAFSVALPNLGAGRGGAGRVSAAGAVPAVPVAAVLAAPAAHGPVAVRSLPTTGLGAGVAGTGLGVLALALLGTAGLRRRTA